MRWIKKNRVQTKNGITSYTNEPEEFQNWKKHNRKKTYQEFHEPIKNEDREKERQEAKGALYKSLKEEQYDLCCYCGSRITFKVDPPDRDCHIEHVKPQSQFPKDTMGYTNMLLSCNGKKSNPSENHCGHKRKNWYDDTLFISPLKKNCEDSFQYLRNGEIRSKKENRGSQETIDKLNLNSLKLIRLRQIVLRNAEFDKFSSKKRSEKEIIKEIEKYKKPGSNGQLPPFAFVITSLLKEELGID